MRFYRLALVELGVRGRERGSPARVLQYNHNPPWWDSNPRTRIQRAQPGSYERPGQPRTMTDDQESPADQKQGTTFKVPPLPEYSSRSLSLPRAGWRDPLSGNSPPDWTGRFWVSRWPAAIGGRACRRLGALPPREALLSSPVSTFFFDGAESELRGEGGSAHVRSQKHVRYGAVV